MHVDVLILTVGQAVTSVAIHPIILQNLGPVTALVDFSTGYSHQQHKHQTPHHELCAGSNAATAGVKCPFIASKLKVPCLLCFTFHFTFSSSFGRLCLSLLWNVFFKIGTVLRNIIYYHIMFSVLYIQKISTHSLLVGENVVSNLSEIVFSSC